MSEQINNKSELFEFKQICRMIIRLGKAAHAYGSQAGRLETYLKRLSGTFRPGSIVLMAAIILLVSCSVGFRGLVHTAEGNAAATGEFVQMFLVALTLTAGLVVANTLVKPIKSL